MRDISQLHPRLQTIIATCQTLWANAGLNVGIGECLRTVEEQDALYAQGRTTEGEIVTYATGYDYSSQHQWGIAFDIYQNDANDPYPDPSTSTFWTDVSNIAKANGLAWGGDWTSPVDMPHFYLPDWGDTTTLLKSTYGTPEAFFATWVATTDETTYYTWMGWTNFESIYDYDDPRGLSVIQTNGHAYGRYQFDFEGGLVPFMQSCYDYNSSAYSGFAYYIGLGVGNEELINNTQLHNLFITYAEDRTSEFWYLQDKNGIEDYLLEAAGDISWDILNAHPVVVGSLFSMAIRFGPHTASNFFPSSGTTLEVLNTAYAMASEVYYDSGRWISGSDNSQYDKAIAAISSHDDFYYIPYGHNPIPVRRIKLPVWMMCRRWRQNYGYKN